MKQVSAVVMGVLVLVSLQASARAMQAPYLVLSPGEVASGFGNAVDGGHDLDGDGHDDLLVSAWLAGQQATGAVTVFSGADGHVIHHWVGDALNDLFGVAAAYTDDTNGDGIADVLVSARADFTNFIGYARLYSGADGQPLHEFAPIPEGHQNASIESLDGLGDVDGDGLGDVALLSRWKAASGGGSIQVRSGGDGSLIYTKDLPLSLGLVLRGVGDMDGDGAGDYVVGASSRIEFPASGWPANILHSGTARAFSGVDGRLIHEWVGEGRYDRLGSSVDGVGDVDGDGHADVVVGAPQLFSSLEMPGPGYARVYSGRDGSLLWEWRGDRYDNVLGSSVSGAGDVDGDGVPDILVGDFTDEDLTRHSGSLRVHSGRDGSLLHQFCLGAGVLQTVVEPPVIGAVAGMAGDVDGDGRDDVAIIGQIHSPGDPDVESIWVVRGRDMAWHDVRPVPPPHHSRPRLSACGVLEAGNPVTILLTDAPPLRPVWFVGVADSVPGSLSGGAPAVLAGPLLTNGHGAVAFTLHGLAGLPNVPTLTVRAVCLNASGLTESNAIHAVVE